MTQDHDVVHGEPSPKRPAFRVVDRHNALIGQARLPPSSQDETSLEVEISDALEAFVSSQEGRIRVPRSWIDGLRRDEIRLSLGLHDPELLASLRRI